MDNKTFVEPNFGFETWTAADGTVFLIKDLPHDYLSNIYWFVRLVQLQYSKKAVYLRKLSMYMGMKFGGIKEFSPQYQWEVDELKRNGLVDADGFIYPEPSKTSMLHNSIGRVAEKFRTPSNSGSEVPEVVLGIIDKLFADLRPTTTMGEDELREKIRNACLNAYWSAPGPAFAG